MRTNIVLDDNLVNEVMCARNDGIHMDYLRTHR